MQPLISKRFLFMMLAVSVLLGSGWMIVAAMQNKIVANQKEITELTAKIADLSQQSNAPDEQNRHLAHANRDLQQQVDFLVKALHYPSEAIGQNQGITDFQGALTAKWQSLRQKANKSGIDFQAHALGFAKLAADQTISPRHWQNLELGYQAASEILQIANRKNLKAIQHLDYPGLNQNGTATSTQFINGFPIQISCVGTFQFLMRLLHHFSRDPKGSTRGTPPFLALVAADISRKAQDKSEELLQFQLTLNALQINREGEIAPNLLPKENPASERPIWDKY